MKRPRKKKSVSGADYDPMNAGRRRHRRRQELGPDARCAGCGETDVSAVRKFKRSVLEQHHPFGEAHEPDVTIVLCRTCHAKYTAAQYDDGVPLTPQPSTLERLVAANTAFGSFLKQSGENLLGLSDRAKEVVKRLDQKFPDWRDGL